MFKKPKKKSDDMRKKLIEAFGCMGDREESKILMKILDVQMATVKRTNAFVADIVNLSVEMSKVMSELHSLEQDREKRKGK